MTFLISYPCDFELRVVGLRMLENVQFVKAVLRQLTVPKFVTTSEVGESNITHDNDRP
jgi:putative lipoic acid-binding regulatory protein